MQTASKIWPTHLRFDRLPDFAKFLLNEKLDDFAREVIRISRKLNLPLLKHFEDWSQEKIFETARKNYVEFFGALANNEISTHLETNFQRWLKDQLPGLGKNDIVADDLALLSYIRKQAFLHFLPEFTNDSKDILALVNEIDRLFLEQDSLNFKAFFETLRDKIYERENLYAQAQALTNLGNWTWQPETDEYHWSEELFNIYEIPVTTKISAEFLRSFIHPEDADHVHNKMETAFANKSSFNYDYRIVTRSGKTKVLQAIGEIREENQILQLFGTVQDITEKHKLIKQLQESESLFKQAESLANIGSWKWEIGSESIEWSDELYRIYDLEPQSIPITLELFKSFIHPEDRNYIEEGVSMIVDQQQQDFTFRIITQKGSKKTLRSLAKVQVNSQGEIVAIIGTEQDITERQNMLDQLRDSEQLYKQAQALAHVGNWRFDIEKNEVFWSDELYRIYGLEPQSEHLTYETYQQFIHPDDRALVVQTVANAINNKKNYEFQHRIILRNGDQRIIYANGEVITNSEGKPVFLNGTTHDITERQQLIERSLENQRFIKKIADATPSIITTYNIKTGKYNFISEGLTKLLGYDPEIPMKEGTQFFLERLHPDDYEETTSKNSAAVEEANSHNGQDKIVEFIYRIKHANGEYRWLQTFGTIFDRDAQGLIENVLNISIDITERKLAEQKVREQEHFIKHIADASPAILYLLDAKADKILYINHEIRFVLGYDPADIIEIPSGLTPLYHQEDLPLVLENKKQLHNSSSNSIIEFECRMKNTKDDYVWLLVREIIFERDENGEPKEILGAALDITERKEIENTLSQRNIQLQQSNASLEEFAYVASHDLKEPLRKISIFGDRLLGTQYMQLSEEGKNYMDKIIDSSRRMQKLITDLLSVSMISADKSFEHYSLATILEETNKVLEYKIEEKNARIVATDLPEAWLIPSQFRQLFQNLINNSLKFIHPGTHPEIKISHEMMTSRDIQQFNLPSGKYLRLEFQDNGIGFDNIFANKIFTIFQRLHSKSEYEGTGIGLAICKKIVENHSGLIFARGEINGGATFTIIIPA